MLRAVNGPGPLTEEERARATRFAGAHRVQAADRAVSRDSAASGATVSSKAAMRRRDRIALPTNPSNVVRP
jgi:hypothetical protein